MTLQEQAENIISKLDLLEILGTFGEVHVVGNVAFATTTKPDIDIQIYCSLHYEDAANVIVQALAGLGLADIKERRLRKSKKYLVISKFQEGETVWDIDITLTQPSRSYLKDSYQFYLDYMPKMTPEKLEAIVSLKQEFANTKISGDNSAYYIYQAVLDENISTVPEMKKYLNTRKSYK